MAETTNGWKYDENEFRVKVTVAVNEVGGLVATADYLDGTPNFINVYEKECPECPECPKCPECPICPVPKPCPKCPKCPKYPKYPRPCPPRPHCWERECNPCWEVVIYNFNDCCC